MNNTDVYGMAEQIYELIIRASTASRREARVLHEQYRPMGDELAQEFGHRLGLKLAKTPFTIPVLARRGIGRTRMSDYHHFSDTDHAYCYREMSRPYRAAAIAAHLYDVPQELHEWAAKEQVKAELVSDFPSWWFPGRTTLVLYTPLPQVKQ